MKTVHLIAGTRPEAIKLAPLVPALREEGLKPVFVASGQHPTMVHQALDAFGLAPDLTLSVERRTGTQAELMTELIGTLGRLTDTPSAVVVQGDTTTVLAAAMVAFWTKTPVVHLEAGLRSHDLAAPFPEEANRKMVGQIAGLHLAPTADARANLESEGIAKEDVVVTGNTVVDAVLAISQRQRRIEDASVSAFVDRAHCGASRLLLVTMHRRESWGAPLDRVLASILGLLDKYQDVEVIVPVHPNPQVGAQVRKALGHHTRALVVAPLAYQVLVPVLAASTLVLSDSGGIQEEAPTFGVPVMVLRDVTERIEAVQAGCAVLVGTNPRVICETASRLLDDDVERKAMVACGNPFGDGRAARRAAMAISWRLCEKDNPPDEFVF